MPEGGGTARGSSRARQRVHGRWLFFARASSVQQATFNAAAVGVHGSGWCWLGYNRATDGLEIATCANQDPLESTTGKIVAFSGSGLQPWCGP